MSDGDLAERRASLIERKKLELDEVNDRHDSLLRELFHLQKFVTLIGFDPNVAKWEKSEVWEEFRAPYDLWDHSSSGPSSRRTRRAINERRESMTVSTSQTAATSRKHKPPDVERLIKKGSMPNLTTTLSTSALAHKRSLDTPKPYRAKVINNKPFTRPVSPSVISRKRPFGEQDHEGEHDYSGFPRASSPTTTNGAEQGVDDIFLTSSPKKRKQNRKEQSSSATTDLTTPFPPIAPRPSSPFAPPESSLNSSPGGTPLPKRIRLIVRPAPLPVLATHPDQLPRPTLFGGSLSKLLSSFALLEEGEETDLVERRNTADPGIRGPGYITPGDEFERPKLGLSWEKFDESVKAEVEVWRRIREVRARGGLRCMRGWEIVRGEEDEPAEVEEEGEEDESLGAQAEKGGEILKPLEGDEGQAQNEGPVEATEDSRNMLEDILDNVDAISTDQGQTGLEHSRIEGLNDLPTVMPQCFLPNTLAIASVANGNASHTIKQYDSPQTPSGPSTDLGQGISPIPDITSAPPGISSEYADRTNAQPPIQADLPSVDETMSTGPTKWKEPVIEPLVSKPNETSTELEMLIPRPITPDFTAEPSRPSTPSNTLSLPFPNFPFLPPSHHETLLAAIPTHARRIKTVPQVYRHRPAILISRYWERLQGAADRLAAAEDRRIRAGARALARGVVAKAWKDAVAVIRIRIREREEAEQAREGRKHLAAILEQSSALLETQQEDLGLTRRPGGRSRSASSGRSRSRSSQIDEEDGEGSEGSGGTEIEEGVDEEGDSEMLLDPVSRGGSEASGDDREVMELEDGDSDVDVGDITDIAAFVVEPKAIQFGSPDEIINLREIFDSAPDQDLDGMPIAEQDPHSPRILNAVSNVQSVDKTRNQSTEDSRNMAANGAVPQDQVITTNGRHKSNTSTPSPPSTSAMQGPPSIAPTPPVVRKLTLKLKSPESIPKESRRSSRRILRTAGGDPDSEADDLVKEAEIPLEEIMRRYGFIGINEVGLDQSSTPRELDSDDESETQVGDEDEGQEGQDSQTAGALLGLEDVQTPKEAGIRPPFLLRGTLRPYQQSGLEWLISGYVRGNNGILADEMGLGKTIQTIALLAHLACDRGVWGPHLIIVPTSVILNWEMEFKKFLPGFKVLSYYGSIKERKERRVGWNTEHSFNVVVTSYQLVLADQAIFRRKKWHYMILDEAHNIKNFKSQRWATLFSFNSERRLLITGTPLQNNITELWSLLYFVQPDTANKQQFEEWFLETMRHAVEAGNTMDEHTRDTIDKLHTVLRPYILRRLKCDVEQQLPAKHEHIVYCRLSKRQRYLYDEFMSRAQTKETLAGGNFLSIVNCLMQLRKVCNHPDLFEVRPILTSFAIPVGRSAVANYEIKELLVRRRLLKQFDDDGFNFYNHSFDLIPNATESTIVAEQRATLTPSQLFPNLDTPGEPPPKDLRTVAGNKRWREYQRMLETRGRRRRIEYINAQRNTRIPILGFEKLRAVRSMTEPLVPADILEQRKPSPDTKFGVARMIRSYAQREEYAGDIINRFAFATPPVVALDVPRLSLVSLAPCNYSGDSMLNPTIQSTFSLPTFDILHRASVKLQIAFPDSSLLQYDCGKLQELDALLRAKNAGGHRVLIFTQMTRVLDILEIFLNFHGYRYLRLDGSTKIEQRQVVTERFNVDSRIFAFIASSRSGGVGINLTGADTVIFYDSDYNPSMDRQCEDRAHRIGQTREVSIYRFISKHTVEEAMLRKANQKRLLDDIVIQQGEFDWRQVMVDDVRIEHALAEVEDKVDADAAKMAMGEEQRMDWDDFGAAGEKDGVEGGVGSGGLTPRVSEFEGVAQEEDEEEDGLSPIEKYMLRVVENDWDFFG
ncbi:helicase SWR1 [Rhizoctonia solani 123E]|uniref:Helicase SWR1 n=1 Tax=Rhizoctonia solani 123E TaxID=1423351 RepID=A0A074STY9_9AGAM|nr:helicase SWR1 [Rhizoctonia solani 123E]